MSEGADFAGPPLRAFFTFTGCSRSSEGDCGGGAAAGGALLGCCPWWMITSMAFVGARRGPGVTRWPAANLKVMVNNGSSGTCLSAVRKLMALNLV